MRRLSIAITITASTLLLPLPSSASCAPLVDIDTAFANAKVVFIGEIVELADGDRTATVEVEQVLKGSPLPAVVIVHGSLEPSPPGSDRVTGSSVDRRFGLGRYVFFPINSGAPFEDNECTNTHRAVAPDDSSSLQDTPTSNPPVAVDIQDSEGTEPPVILPAEVTSPTTEPFPTATTVWVLSGLAALIAAAVWKRRT